MKEINITEIDKYENYLTARDIYCNGSLLLRNNSILNKDTILYLKRYSNYLLRIYVYDTFEEESKENSSLLIFDNVKRMVDELLNITMMYYSYIEHDDTKLIHDTIHLFIVDILSENYYQNYLENLYINNIKVFKHVMRTVIMSIILAIKLNMNTDIIKAVGIGALLHDIGKIKLFNKYPSLINLESYNYEEYQLLRTHPTLGYMELENNPLVPNISKKIVLLHHVWNDFEGSYCPVKNCHLSYPRSYQDNHLSKEQKDDIINIIQISNYFDNLHSKFSKENEKISPFYILVIRKKMLEYSNIIYSDKILQLQFNYFSIFMKGDFIKVGNKDAVVVHNTSNINRPVVKLLENNKILDLSKNLKLKINFEKVEGCDVNEYYNTIRKDEKYYYM